MKALDLTNQVFGRLTAVSVVRKNGKRMWACICTCGGKSVVRAADLKTGNSSSCGCFNREQTALSNSTTHPQRKHGMKGSPTYKTWTSMKQRCLYKKSISFPRYGARGISVCERWKNSFENFLKDMGPRPEGFQIDRINNDGNYEPSNCRWVSPKQNSRKKDSTRFLKYKNKTLSLVEWSEIVKIKTTTISERLKRGWSVEEALSRDASS